MTLRRILMATDLSERSDRALARALQLAGQYDARLEVLHAIDEALPTGRAEWLRADGEQRIKSLLASRPGISGLDVAVSIVRDRPFAGILRQADASDADLIVLGTHREDALRNLFVGSTAWRVLREASRPVLVVKTPVSGPYRRPLVALDISEGSRRALELACALASGTELSAVHAFQVAFPAFVRTEQTAREAGGERRQELSNFFKQVFASMDPALVARLPAIRRNVREGETLEVILRECERLSADLLILGTCGRTGLAHAVLGSTAEPLLRLARCDILAIRAGALDVKSALRAPEAVPRRRASPG
ncbi:MAG TPA: universal stress protein, partial [Alphaproteobacteria bacterium]|nr:universal stress protein [Alphaproteobacteria bacterium]